MIDNEILDQALGKKNKEIEKLNRQLEETKKQYETKIKNLMGSVNNLKTQNLDLSNGTKDNVRVNLIKSLKDENNNKEKVITLLRRMIDDDAKVDTYLLKEFSKMGDQHVLTYEELKIKIRQLEAEIVSQKFKKVGKKSENNEDSLTMTKMKTDILIYEDNITNLTNENNRLKEANNKLERLQTELYERLKKYNQEIGEMKSIYDTVKENIEEEHKMLRKELEDRCDSAEKENTKFREKIRELIKIGEENTKSYIEKLKRSNNENDILKRLLESKKQEIEILVEELNKYNDHLDGKSILVKTQKIAETPNKEIEEKNKFLEKLIKQKDYQLDLIKSTVDDKDEVLQEKELEIELLTNKLQEMEQIAFQNYLNNKK